MGEAQEAEVSFIERLSDRKLVLACSGVLFLLCAWPLTLVRLPPYQDVPNHLVSVFVLENPALYPELVGNSFFKTNSAVFAWVHFVGALVGRVWAMRLFILGVLAANAYAFPRLVLELAGRRRTLVASLFLAPMVHNWFVSMGMLNFALGVPLSLLALVALQRQRKTPSLFGAARVLFLVLATWYAHFVPFVILVSLVSLELLLTLLRSRSEAKKLGLAIGPPIVLSLVVAAARNLSDVGSGHQGAPIWSAAWEVPYVMWAEWAYGFTELSAGTLASCVVLLVLGVRRWREPLPFFSPVALVLLTLGYVVSPHTLASWFYASTRLVPFIWVGLLLRVPESVPRWLTAALLLISVSFSASLAVDFVRLTRDREELDAGIPSVPEHARLLPLIFDRKGRSVNTGHLAQAWGSYVLEKRTAAPLVFARSRAYGVSYRQPPLRELDHIVLEDTIERLATPDSFCRATRLRREECIARYHDAWMAFWELIGPRFEHVLFWGAGPEARALVPQRYRPVFEQGKLVIYAQGPLPSER